LEYLILIVTQWRLFDQLLRDIEFGGNVCGHLRPLELIGGGLWLLKVLLLLRSLTEIYEMPFFPYHEELSVD